MFFLQKIKLCAQKHSNFKFCNEKAQFWVPQWMAFDWQKYFGCSIWAEVCWAEVFGRNFCGEVFGHKYLVRIIWVDKFGGKYFGRQYL